MFLSSFFMSTLANIDGDLLKSLRRYLNRHNYQVYIGKGAVSGVSKGLMRLSMTKIVDKLEKDPKTQEESYIIDATTAEIGTLEHLGKKFPSIVIFDSQAKMDQVLRTTRIDQQLYGLLLSDKTIHEVYTINEITVSRQLAAFDEETGEFERDPDYDSDFVERRSDLQGVHLKAFVCTQAPYLFVEHIEEDQKVYQDFPDGLTLEVISPKRISGIFRDMQVMKNLFYALCIGTLIKN